MKIDILECYNYWDDLFWVDVVLNGISESFVYTCINGVFKLAIVTNNHPKEVTDQIGRELNVYMRLWILLNEEEY